MPFGRSGRGRSDVEVVNVMPVVAHLAVVEVPQRIPHGGGGIGGKIALCGIE
jgi:hypothetical protein